MLKLNCLLLLVLFTLFTTRAFYSAGENRKSLSTISSSYPFSDEKPAGESDSNNFSMDSEDEDYQIMAIQDFAILTESSQKLIQLQEQIFKDLPSKVSTPPPRS